MTQQRVINKINSRKGVIVPDQDHICGSGEVLVLYDGDTIYLGTRISELEHVKSEA